MGCSGSKNKKPAGKALDCDHCGRAIDGEYEMLKLPSGKKANALHPHCKDNWCDRHADLCDHCRKPMIKTATTITVNNHSAKIHPECEKQWRKSTGNKESASDCYVCHKTFKDGEQIHVISCQELSQPAHVHKGCIEKLHKNLGRVCDQCGKPITGQLTTLKGPAGSAKLHTECVSKFEKAAKGK